MKQTTIARRELLRKYIAVLFPSVRAYFNVWMLIVFFSVVLAVREAGLVLISALATGYFLNEWIKEIYRK